MKELVWEIYHGRFLVRDCTGDCMGREREIAH